MKHARSDYNRIQDPDGLIPEDEPVMLFRAQDQLMPAVLREYMVWLREEGLNEMAYRIARHIRAVEEWQETHGCKLPDMPQGA